MASDLAFYLERVTGIEPALSAWEAEVLPLDHTRERSLCDRRSEDTARPLWRTHLDTRQMDAINNRSVLVPGAP